MALKTYTRLSDGVEVTVDDSHLTSAILKKLGDPKKADIPTALKTKKTRESNK